MFLKRILEKRAKVFTDDRKVEWSLGEALAFASILKRRYANSNDRTGFRARYFCSKKPCSLRQSNWK
ncbi:hypothetical protein ACEQPO_16375 [Bacillus sp. SL00103]